MALELLITHSSVIQLCYPTFHPATALFIFYSLLIFTLAVFVGISV